MTYNLRMEVQHSAKHSSYEVNMDDQCEIRMCFAFFWSNPYRVRGKKQAFFTLPRRQTHFRYSAQGGKSRRGGYHPGPVDGRAVVGEGWKWLRRAIAPITIKKPNGGKMNFFQRGMRSTGRPRTLKTFIWLDIAHS